MSALFQEWSANEQKIDCTHNEGHKTVIVKQARGRLGNHLCLIMSLINYELKYDVKGYLTEQSRLMLDSYFKGELDLELRLSRKDIDLEH